MSAEEKSFQAALEEFKSAALALDRVWEPDRQVDGYPDYLPDFGEFASDLQGIEAADGAEFTAT